MSAATIRDDLEDVLSAVTNIGRVHDYERFNNDWTAFLALFKTTIGGSEVVRGWTIAYDGFARPERMDFDPGVLRAHAFTVRGFLGWDDSAESEKTAQNLGETVCNAFDDDTVLHSNLYYDCDQATLTKESRLFGGVLCHYLEIKMVVTEYRA